MTLYYFARQVKNSLTTKRVLEYYGLHVNARGFSRCPFHDERTASFKVYDGDRGYYCFGCGKSGDVIKFVQEFFNLSFNDSIKKLDQDFSLGLGIGEKMSKSQRRYIAQKAFQRKKRISEQKKRMEFLEKRYWNEYDEWLRLDQNFEKYKPNSPDDKLNDLFVEAACKLSQQKYKLEIYEDERREYEKSISNN